MDDDAFFTDDTGIVTLTDEEEAEVMRLVKAADEVNSDINYDDLPSAFLNIYINSEIKSGSFLEELVPHLKDLSTGILREFKRKSIYPLHKGLYKTTLGNGSVFQ